MVRSRLSKRGHFGRSIHQIQARPSIDPPIHASSSSISCMPCHQLAQHRRPSSLPPSLPRRRPPLRPPALKRFDFNSSSSSHAFYFPLSLLLSLLIDADNCMRASIPCWRGCSPNGQIDVPAALAICTPFMLEFTCKFLLRVVFDLCYSKFPCGVCWS